MSLKSLWFSFGSSRKIRYIDLILTIHPSLDYAASPRNVPLWLAEQWTDVEKNSLTSKDIQGKKITQNYLDCVQASLPLYEEEC